MDTTPITVGSLWEMARERMLPIRVEKIDGDQIHAVNFHPDRPDLTGKVLWVIGVGRFRTSVLNRRGKPWRSGYVPFAPKPRPPRLQPSTAQHDGAVPLKDLIS